MEIIRSGQKVCNVGELMPGEVFEDPEGHVAVVVGYTHGWEEEWLMTCDGAEGILCFDLENNELFWRSFDLAADVVSVLDATITVS